MAALGIWAESCAISCPCHWVFQVRSHVHVSHSSLAFFFPLVYVSTLTSLAIAVDRYFVIVHPFRSRMRLGVCILLIIVIWIVGISISLPLAIYMRFDRIKCEVSALEKSKQVPHSNASFLLALCRNIGHNIHLDVSSTSHRSSFSISFHSQSSRSATTRCGSHWHVAPCQAERAYAKRSKSAARNARIAC